MLQQQLIISNVLYVRLVRHPTEQQVDRYEHKKETKKKGGPCNSLQARGNILPYDIIEFGPPTAKDAVNQTLTDLDPVFN